MLNLNKSVNITVSNREFKCKMSTREMKKVKYLHLRANTQSGLLITENISQAIANGFPADRGIYDSAHKRRPIRSNS